MKHIAYLILLTLVCVSCGTDSHHFKLDGQLLHMNQGEFYVIVLMVSSMAWTPLRFKADDLLTRFLVKKKESYRLYSLIFQSNQFLHSLVSRLT